jgi:DNA (cytosine-5)-methyltransferase 1
VQTTAALICTCAANGDAAVSITFGSLFTGIGGFDLGFKRAGMKCAWQVENDTACNVVLNHHWPDVPKYGDVRNVGKHNLEPVDLISGGFPCQDLSVAGKRKGLAGERSGLWFEFHRIIEELEPGWVVVENVPGLLSSNSGEDFAIILRGLVQLGYGVSWRILDSQYFGVPQRRRRVFIVGSLRNGRSAEVLFEREGCTGDTPEGKEAWENPTPNVAKCIGSHSGRYDLDSQGAYIPDISLPLAHSRSIDHQDESQQTYVAFSADGYGLDATKDLSPTLKHGGSEPNHHNAYRKMAIAYSLRANPGGTLKPESGHDTTILSKSGVRRLTPTECERLQGFPDGWTGGQSDSARYRQLGNAVTVPVIEWIARKICGCE